MIEFDKTEGSKIKKEIQLMIEKNVQKITCVGEFSERKCETHPSFIAFTECKNKDNDRNQI